VTSNEQEPGDRVQGIGRRLRCSLVPRPKANQKAKGKRQKCSSPPFSNFDFPFSIFQLPLSSFQLPFSIFEFLFSLFGFPRPSYLLDMEIQTKISFGINGGKFRRGTFLLFLVRKRSYSLKSSEILENN
jgi:hypothetical protein